MTAFTWFLTPTPTLGQAQDTTPVLGDLSLEELLSLEVTSVSRRAERLFDVAAAVHVVTHEEIRRSGARTIPEALRMVPGVQSNRFTASQYAVSARGFGDVFANKMLVLIDGRSLYSPLFAGVRWEERPMFLEDVDRIEVIRGPGASLWGANAVNGVINIVTRSAEESQGGYATATWGEGDVSELAARYGGELGPGHWRAYVQALSHDGFVDQAGQPFRDDWESLGGGIRGDWDLGRSYFSLHADVKSLEYGKPSIFPISTPPYEEEVRVAEKVDRGNLHGLWSFRASDTQDLSLRAYLDFADVDSGDDSNRHREFDAEFQHRLHLDRHEIVWGLQYRRYQEDLFGVTRAMFPAERTDQLFGAFVQDQIRIGDRLYLTLGSKVEHNDYTGFEIQPNARVAWLPDESRTVWASASRALRTPTRVEHDLRFLAAVFPGPPEVGGLLINYEIAGSEDVISEVLNSYEIGFRQRMGSVSVDLAGFYNDYDRLRSGTLLDPALRTGPGGPSLLVREIFNNEGIASAFGLDASVKWSPTSNWRLEAVGSWLDLREEFPVSALPGRGEFAKEGSAPPLQAQLRSQLSLRSGLEIDGWFRFTDRITFNDRAVPSYTALDLRFGWAPSSTFRLDLGGKDLLSGPHQEFPTVPGYNLGSWVDRSWYAKISWGF